MCWQKDGPANPPQEMPDLANPRPSADGYDDVNTPDYWRHLAANVRYGERGVIDDEVKRLLLAIAERYEAIGDIVEKRGPLTKSRRRIAKLNVPSFSMS
jgi:hypothetical protein